MADNINVQGYKYYLIEDNVVRISKDKNIINDKWTKLKMDGLVAFHIISNNDGARHIRVAIYTNNNYQTPSVIWISNFIAEWDHEAGDMSFGRTFNKYSRLDDSFWENDSLCKVDNIDYSEYIAAYKEDSFKNIYDQLLNKDKFTEVLVETNLAFSTMENSIAICDNLYDFMEHGAFSYDYDCELGVEQVDFIFNVKDGILINQHDLESYLGHKLLQPAIVKYNRVIVLDAIKKDYTLFRDSTGILYLITYLRGNVIVDEEHSDLLEWEQQL